MEKVTVYMMSLEETMEGKYYDIATADEFVEARRDFLEYCEKRNFSDDIEVQYIDGPLSGRATDYIYEILELAEEFEEELEIVGEIFNSVSNIEDTRNCLENRNYSLYPDVINGHYQDENDIFESYLDDIDFLHDVPQRMRCYIDYQAIKRDFEIEGMEIIEHSQGYIVLNHY